VHVLGHWCTDFVPHSPSEKQLVFLKLDNLEAYYGGAAGGGKSDALLMAALQYVDIPGYAALLLRRSYTDLSLPKALMDRAYEWLNGTSAKWNDRDKTWRFPSGATLTFGYLENEKDKYRYQSSEYAYVGFDEVTQFTESQYTYLFSRLRRLAGSEVPVRMRSASNPDGEGLEWVRARFVPDEYLRSNLEERFGRIWTKGETCFVPARLEDNPHIDRAEYDRSLDRLDVLLQARLRSGDFETEPQGGLIKREWFGADKFFPDLPDGARWLVRAWDLAVRDKDTISAKRKGKLPDYHATVKATIHNGDLWLGGPDLWRGEWADAVEKIMATMMVETSIRHGTGRANHETAAVQALVRKGFGLIQYPEPGDKASRAAPWINQAKIGRVKLVGSPEQWKPFMHWWFKFGTADGAYDDSVDAVSGVAQMLGLSFERHESSSKPAWSWQALLKSET
jgi:phage terminase large subunit-like protein